MRTSADHPVLDRGGRRAALAALSVVIMLFGTACAAADPAAGVAGTTDGSATTQSSDDGRATPAPEGSRTVQVTDAGRATQKSRPAPSSTTSEVPTTVVTPTPSTPTSTPVPTGPSAPVATGPSAPSASAPQPVSLDVESIGISESLITLGLTDTGTAAVPADYSRAGWFTGGGRPGTIGPTVILGHVDSKTGPAVFFRLREVQVGAEIRLGLADSTTATYRVVAVDRYPKDDFPTFAVYGATPRDVVRLVTCGGEFDRSAGSYTDNIVVTAERIM